MQEFFSFISNITYYLLFAAAAAMLAPAGKYRKFVSLVTGLGLIVVVLTPLRGVGGDFDAAGFFAGVAGREAVFDAGEFEHLHHAQLSAAFAEQLTLQLEDMLAREGIALHEAVFTHSEDFARITSVRVEVSESGAARRVPFIRIEPVQVGRGRDEAPADCDPIAAQVKNRIADFYAIPHAHIYVTIRQ